MISKKGINTAFSTLFITCVYYILATIIKVVKTMFSLLSYFETDKTGIETIFQAVIG